MIDVINLEKHFGSNKILKGINITVNKGDILVVIGPSGSGKSTFLRREADGERTVQIWDGEGRELCGRRQLQQR